MAEAHLDHPGEITWFSGYGPAPILGVCPHTSCPHDLAKPIAWGPDYEHYILDVCEVPDGCAGACRSWHAEWPEGEGPGGRRWRLPEPSDWKHVPAVAVVVDAPASLLVPLPDDWVSGTVNPALRGDGSSWWRREVR